MFEICCVPCLQPDKMKESAQCVELMCDHEHIPQQIHYVSNLVGPTIETMSRLSPVSSTAAITTSTSTL